MHGFSEMKRVFPDEDIITSYHSSNEDREMEMKSTMDLRSNISILEFKKMKNRELVILRDNKIVKIKPE
jgi:hypothetical protein